MLKHIDLNREHISTSEASKRSALSMGYLTQLLRDHALDGFQLGREWFIYSDSLERFLATPRKSGPKGPRKKQHSSEEDQAATQKEIHNSSRLYLTTPQASEMSGLSKVYLAHLLKRGALEGFQIGRDWCVYTDSLDKFLATPRKSGPKGPQKKPTIEQENGASDQKNEHS